MLRTTRMWGESDTVTSSMSMHAVLLNYSAVGTGFRPMPYAYILDLQAPGFASGHVS
jgi:hypothetical protein